MNFLKRAMKKGGESFTLLTEIGCPDDLNLEPIEPLEVPCF
jgi:hypothetical protein